ncbi:hypothetical protein G7046_g145 [Stylonectria norvegica]|nr:hypothetical protein G7046_g145 [Stylonectria norvegica]
MSISSSPSIGRHRLRSAYWGKQWAASIVPVVAIGLIIQLVFIANLSYLYGTLFKSGSREHALKVLAVDYDGAEIGQSLSLAYESLQADTFPTLDFRPASDYPTPDLLRQAVCKHGYWAAIYTHPGASSRLMDTITGNSTSEYNPGDTISYTYDAVYYPIIGASIIVSNMQTLISVASKQYYGAAAHAFSAVNLTNPISAAAFLDPIQATSNVIMPTNQGTRVLLNTVSMVMPALMQFFFLMGMNGVFTDSNIFANLAKRDVYFLRLFISKVYTLCCALGMTGYIWAFREDWAVSGSQFAETWMCLWLFMEVSYLIVDTVLDVVVPIRFFSLFLVTYLLTSVASTIYPFALSAGFYRVGYIFPAHNTWSLLMEIWSEGCKPQHQVALPILLVWWAVGHVTSAWAVWRRCLMNEPSILLNQAKEMDTSHSVLEAAPQGSVVVWD